MAAIIRFIQKGRSLLVELPEERRAVALKEKLERVAETKTLSDADPAKEKEILDVLQELDAFKKEIGGSASTKKELIEFSKYSDIRNKWFPLYDDLERELRQRLSDQSYYKTRNRVTQFAKQSIKTGYASAKSGLAKGKEAITYFISDSLYNAKHLKGMDLSVELEGGLGYAPFSFDVPAPKPPSPSVVDRLQALLFPVNKLVPTAPPESNPISETAAARLLAPQRESSGGGVRRRPAREEVNARELPDSFYPCPEELAPLREESSRFLPYNPSSDEGRRLLVKQRTTSAARRANPLSEGDDDVQIRPPQKKKQGWFSWTFSRSQAPAQPKGYKALTEEDNDPLFRPSAYI